MRNPFMKNGLVIGIDATNLRQGGGRTHLIELLRAADPGNFGIRKIVVWGGSETLSLIDNKAWLLKRSPQALNSGLFSRAFWQIFSLSSAARSDGCDVLLVPGGSFSGDFHCVVTMSQNLLPFEWKELRRYGCSLLTVKLLLLRLIQSRSFRRSTGVIFLSHYALRSVLKVTGPLVGALTVVPHGLNSRFTIRPRPQKQIENYTKSNPYRLLYVSIIDQYKHQWHVVEAVAKLRKLTGWAITLDLVGPAYPRALHRLESAIETHDPHGTWAHYHGAVPYTELHRFYSKANLGVFASSCENMPNILLEMMGAGLPVACSDLGPMTEIMGDAGVYFNPECSESIYKALSRLINSIELRSHSSSCCFDIASKFTWQRCAHETLAFLVTLARNIETAH